MGFEAEEAAVVGMALALKVGFEEEGGVDFGCHDDGAGGGEPAVELFGPGAVEDFRRGLHGAFAGYLEGSCGKIGRGDDDGHETLIANSP